ncbi:MAG TPA: M20/M25/M40 family metallo-hydrolase [Polyangia bacterium]
MRLVRKFCIVAVTIATAACAHRGAAPDGLRLPDETALDELQQLTFGGENAEAYWSFEGDRLSLQARPKGLPGAPEQPGCDRIYVLPIKPQPGALTQVSSGLGGTTCAHFQPGGRLVYTSSHLSAPACPAKPDMSQGYVWALTPDYDIFRTKAPVDPTASPLKLGDAASLEALTTTPGYDAEATVCGRDGSIIFTSVRDGDLELYRMDADGKNVKRLTNALGYDGGAFFNRDCSKIVWRASRPRAGKEEDDYKRLLAKNLVRPSKLEIWIANADGTEARAITDLDAASFAPSCHPTEDVIVFSSNVGDPKGREFDIWAMHSNGTGLRRITFSPGFDGFPHFSPDGTLMAFSSNRATAPGQNDTNVFVARWKGLAPLPQAAERPVDRIWRDIGWLADPAREGRGIGTGGLAAAGEYLAKALAAIGAEPMGKDGDFRDPFPVVTALATKPGSKVSIDGQPLFPNDFVPLGFSAEGQLSGTAVMANYGIVSPEHKIDDYAGLDVKGKVVIVRRFAPEEPHINTSVRRNLGDLRRKAWLARERGAVALMVVDWPLPPAAAPPDWQPSAEANLPAPSPSGPGDAGMPVVMIKRASVARAMPLLLAKKPVPVSLDLGLVPTIENAFNVVGRFAAGRGPAKGTVVLGAHYDHLGLGGRHSLAPGENKPHVGADDNASGTAALLEIARQLAEKRADLQHDVVVAFFSGEESGLLGSSHFTRSRAELLKSTRAMINFDMVGRLRDNRLDALGAESALEWPTLVRAACSDLRLSCTVTGDGQGPSDQAAFYAAGIPVLHFFTGTHPDYHKPSDTADRIYPAGAAVVSDLALRVLRAVDAGVALSYQKGKSAPPGGGDARAFHASLGTIPDYAGPPNGAPGVLRGGVRAGGGAEQAGMRRGDVVVRLGEHEIRSVQDLMFALQASKPGETVRAVVIRDGKPVELKATFQEARRGP